MKTLMKPFLIDQERVIAESKNILNNTSKDPQTKINDMTILCNFLNEKYPLKK